MAAYETFIAKKLKTVTDARLRAKLISKRELLPADIGGSMLWIGNPSTASKIVLQFHGGGFFIPASPGHLEWAWQCYVQAGHEQGVDVAVCMLEYTLLPAGPFPKPLQQAAAALNKILEAGFKPADIFIGGDSAGGNISVQLLGHLLHPHPEAQKVDLKEPLAGAFLVSPGVTKEDTAKSFAENAGIDMIPSGILPIVEQYLQDAYKAQGIEFTEEKRKKDAPYVSPLNAPDSWYDDIAKIVSNIYLTIGKREVLRDPALAFCDLLKRKGMADVLTVEVPEDEAHVFIVLEGMAGIKGSATQRMIDWFLATVGKKKN